jgi:hypothetical protein
MPEPETPAPAPGAPPAPPAPGAPPSTPVVETFPRDYVEKLRQEAADYRTKLKTFEDAQAAAEQTRLTEAGRHKEAADAARVQVKRLEAELAARDLRDLRARIARKHGIEDFADRLLGATEDEIEADAKAFAARLPKPAAPPPAPKAQDPAAPLPFPTNPAGTGVPSARASFAEVPSWGSVLGPPKS